jgi:hypothetical protein
MRSPLPLFARLVCFNLAVVTAAQAQSLPHAILTGGVNLSANFDATAFAGAPVCATGDTGCLNFTQICLQGSTSACITLPSGTSILVLNEGKNSPASGTSSSQVGTLTLGLQTVTLSTAGTTSGTSAASASFVVEDMTTQGNWIGKYGTNGYSLAAGLQMLPSYVVFAPQSEMSYTWAASTTDLRALQNPNGVGRAASTWYSSSPFDFAVNFNDGNQHQLALYALDFQGGPRAETVQIVDANTNGVLDTRMLTNFTAGVWLVWTISGSVKINVIPTAPPNGVVSGIFF